jgi:hypothetical protein
MLADLGCESIAVASRIGQAITLIEGHIFDAAMLDLNLNGTESYPIAYVLTARGVPYFFSTGNTLNNVKNGHRDHEVPKKPFTFDQLENMLSGSLHPSR